MCSVVDMDDFQGDLTDVVRGVGSGHVSPSPGAPEGPSPPPPTSDPPSFGDPFVSLSDPLLHPTVSNSFPIFPKDDHIKSQCSVFPRIRISQNNISQDSSTCNSPAMTISGGVAASPWGMINVDTTSNTSSPSRSHVQISSSPRNLGIKRRKSQAKKVVCIPAPAAMNSRSSGEVVPSDLWAWRKYGQKPIKGSPYPRGYYRCSSSKGCSARKQVERSRTDPNMLVITYTSEHNHPWPTQRNALAGSTRSSSSSSSNPSFKSATTSASQNNNSTHLPSSSTPPPPSHAAITVKEEDMDERHHKLEFDNDVNDTYRPDLLPEFRHQPEDFFADLDELEGDSLTMLLTQGFAGDSSGGKGSLEKKTTMPDVFSDFFDDDDSSRSL